MWVDIDRDGHLDLLVCNYVRWTPEQDVFCSLDGKQKSYCTPEAYRGGTCCCFAIAATTAFRRHHGELWHLRFRTQGAWRRSADDDQDGWPDFTGCQRHQPNKLYRNLKNSKFRDVGLAAGLALSEGQQGEAGMGIDAADFDNSSPQRHRRDELRRRMIGLYRSEGAGRYRDVATRVGVGAPRRIDSASVVSLATSIRRRSRPRRRQRSHRRHGAQHSRQCGLRATTAPVSQRPRSVSGCCRAGGRRLEQPRVGRGLAFGDFDNDGDPTC